MTTSERLNSMSPAAQRLATMKLGVRRTTDKVLQASYTPSPVHSLPGDKTPDSLTPRSTRSNSGLSTPGSSTPGSRTPKGKREGSNSASLTDNLLQLPKRKKASDFF